MPIVTSGASPAGIGAQITGSPTTCLFGGLAMPNGQGTMPWVNLNDVTSWFLQDVGIDHNNRAIGIQPLVARARSTYVSDDFLNKIITLTLRYSEASYPIGQALSKLSQGGEQQLTFDNATSILAKYRGARTPRLVRKFAPFLWDVQLEFICREPWFKDINTTYLSPVSLVSAPTTAPYATATAGGSLAVGTYTLAYTYVTASGETAASPATSLTPAVATADYRVQTTYSRRGSRSTGSALQTGMGGAATSSRLSRGYGITRVIPQGSAVTLSGSNLQMSVQAVTFPSWATAVKWYFTGSSPTTGFTVQRNDGSAFTLNTAGNSVAAPSGSSGTANFNVTYTGSVWCEPVYSVVIPASNPNSVTSLSLTNSMSSETLTVTFPGMLLGGRAHTITVDSSAFTVTDENGTSYDYAGSFPSLYPPAGQLNAFVVQCAGSPGNPSGLTLQAAYQSRWEV